jgi:hypothetical protein
MQCRPSDRVSLTLRTTKMGSALNRNQDELWGGGGTGSVWPVVGGAQPMEPPAERGR